MVGCPGSACTTREDLGTRVARGGCGCLPIRSLRAKRPPAELKLRVGIGRGGEVCADAGRYAVAKTSHSTRGAATLH